MHHVFFYIVTLSCLLAVLGGLRALEDLDASCLFVSTDGFYHCLKYSWRLRTLHNIQAASGLAVGILVGANRRIALDENLCTRFTPNVSIHYIIFSSSQYA